MRRWIGIATALAVLLACAACGDDEQQAEQERDAQTRAIMDEILSALQVALPASANLERMRAPQNRAEIGAALDALARNTKALEVHTRPRDARMHQLARSVARDARATRRAFEEGRYGRSAFLLREITENCVVCHSRLPSPGDSPMAEEFLATEDLVALPPEPRATLQIATRRFDDALTTLEELILSSEHPALLLGPITDYLTISIRVKGDFDRPAQTLRQLAQNPHVWEQLRLDIEGWIAALESIKGRVGRKPDLATARELLDEGKRMVDYPQDHAALVHFVAASAILERYVAEHREPSPELAEAYYRLGVVQATIGRNYWVTEAPFLLETAIRMAPDQPFARDAYALLERELLLQYEGADEEELPAPDAAWLAELRGLMRGN